MWCLHGVPQGVASAWNVAVSLLYINDLPENVTYISKVRLYADDVLLYNTIHTKVKMTM